MYLSVEYAAASCLDVLDRTCTDTLGRIYQSEKRAAKTLRVLCAKARVDGEGAMNLTDAEALAQSAVYVLTPHCERIAIAGSIRR